MSADIQVQRDRSWIDAIRLGEERAFEEIFQYYYAPLVAYTTTLVRTRDAAREVVQEVFLKIWENRERWEVRSSLRPYLYRAARNQALDHLNRKYRRVEQGVNGRDWATRDHSDDHVAYSEFFAAYRRAVEGLPERRRTAFVLHREHGMSCAEIARVMTISERTVETHIGKALGTLRQELADLL